MAVSAIHHFSSNIDVGLAKRSLLVIMAFAAQGLNGLDDQGRLCREMRFVTCLTFFKIG